jgi:type IV secretory pathway TraG/TraD family ATPase VirD4
MTKPSELQTFMETDPSNPQTYVKGFDSFVKSEYAGPGLALVAYGLFRLYRAIKGPAPIKGSSFWAKPKHLKKARKLVKQYKKSKNILEKSYMLGNIPLYRAITSVFCCGAPDSGKSFGIHNQLIFENLRDGNPQVITDLQYPEQTSMFVAIAQQFGYAPEDIHLFVPGVEESEIWNLCESADDVKALEMSALIQENASEDDVKKDDFFSPGVKFLLAATMSICRQVKGLDNLLGCRAILNLDDLTDRLKYNRAKLDSIDPWSNAMFDQFKGSAKAEETEASLKAATQIFLSMFANKRIAPAVVGETSFPLYLTGKKLLIIGSPPDLRKTTAPLLTALLSQIVEANAVPEREDALQIAIDECFSIKYKRIITDANENRKYGVYFNLAAQNINQCKEKFSETGMRNFLTAMGHKFWYNPRELESAKYLENVLGSEIKRKTNYTYGEKSTSSTTTEVERKLITLAQIMKIPQGVMIAQTRGISSETEEYIPHKTKVKVSPLYARMTQWAKTEWEFTQAQLIARSPQKPVDHLLEETRLAAEALLPWGRLGDDPARSIV